MFFAEPTMTTPSKRAAAEPLDPLDADPPAPAVARRSHRKSDASNNPTKRSKRAKTNLSMGGSGPGTAKHCTAAVAHTSDRDSAVAKGLPGQIAGFSGTRNGMTPQQKVSFNALMVAAKPSALHHGACVGADLDAVRLFCAAFPDSAVIAWPGVSATSKPGQNVRSVEAVALSGTVEPERTYRRRNEKIVEAADMLYAAPPCRPLPPRGGTKMTISIARRACKPVVIVWPDGEVERST